MFPHSVTLVLYEDITSRFEPIIELFTDSFGPCCYICVVGCFLGIAILYKRVTRQVEYLKRSEFTRSVCATAVALNAKTRSAVHYSINKPRISYLVTNRNMAHSQKYTLFCTMLLFNKSM